MPLANGPRKSINTYQTTGQFQPLSTSRSGFDYMPWYAGKGEIREYLQELNKNGKVGHKV